LVREASDGRLGIPEREGLTMDESRSGSVVRASATANILGGICFALFFVLHPGGGDPPTVQAALSAVYTAEHLLGLVAMLLFLLGLPALLTRVPFSSSILTRVGYPLATVGAYLLGGVIFFDGFFSPTIAANAPTLLDAHGPLNTPPALIILALSGTVWGIGYLLLAVASLRSRRLPVPASALVLIGSILVNLPPQPVGPTPLWLLAVAAVVYGLGLSWWGYAIREGDVRSRVDR
jgi:hypothetical protein